MKTFKYFAKRAVAVLSIAALATLPMKAQVSNDAFYNIDWQFNIPLGNNFSNHASGWGMNFEMGYYVTPELALGGFLSYHTNNEYFERTTLHMGTTALNTDQQHSLFQLPFGVLAHYRFDYGQFQPYVGMKLGAAYAQMTSNYYIFESDKNTWGFFASPEVGVQFYPWEGSMGFHAALYYSIATNQGSLMTYDMNCINSLGFRLGVAF
jgi:outer membrane protein W